MGNQSALLRTAACLAGTDVRVRHAQNVRPRGMNGAVNDEADAAHSNGRSGELIAFRIDSKERRGSFFLGQQAIRVDPKFMGVTKQAHTEVREYRIGPAMRRHEALASGRVATQLPFLRTDDFSEDPDMHAELFWMGIWTAATKRWKLGGACGLRLPRSQQFLVQLAHAGLGQTVGEHHLLRDGEL